MMLSGGSINFEKTRPKMKKVIKQSIPKVVGDQNRTLQIEILKQLSQLLQDPQNVRDSCLKLLIPTFQSHHASAIKILDRLRDLSTDTLLAMLRKLRGVPARTPSLQEKRYGSSRKDLIHKIRTTSEKMLSELGRGVELQAPLAKALAVAGLSLKRTAVFSNFFVEDFNQFSPETKTLQNEISKAIWLLETKVQTQELKTLKLLLDPDANVPNLRLRTLMKKMLTEYLFECNDLDTIPKSLLEGLAFINRNCRRTPNPRFLKEEIEEEVECILSVSAEMKQTVWGFLPNHEFDEDFTDAYMEELEESDDGDDDDHHHDEYDTFTATGDSDADGQQLQPRNILSSRTYSVGLDNLEESCGEHDPVDSKPSISTSQGNCGSSPLIEGKRNISGMLNVESTGKSATSRINENGFSPQFPSGGRLNSISMKGNEPVQGTTVGMENPLEGYVKGVKSMSNEQSTHTNLYLGIQDICDETSMVAYNIIGYMLEKFAHEAGLDLNQCGSSYLRGDPSSQENQEERQNSSKTNEAGSVIVQAVEELVPSFPKSGMEKLKELLGIV
ncbi:uncharacterized protein LOC105628429 isoform X2 [Jatropha curcas]|nr:uncharacterized protein LOC105628429 isoform X2 [Jatropha curcas]